MVNFSIRQDMNKIMTGATKYNSIIYIISKIRKVFIGFYMMYNKTSKIQLSTTIFTRISITTNTLIAPIIISMRIAPFFLTSLYCGIYMFCFHLLKRSRFIRANTRAKTSLSFVIRICIKWLSTPFTIFPHNDMVSV